MLAVFVVSRIPGLMPANFSAAYALAFCAGLYFPGALAWWLPLGVMLATDLALNAWYAWHGVPHVFSPVSLLYLLGNYAGYGVLIGLGRRFKARDSWVRLLGGGLLGALVFYLVTNTLSWFINPFHNPEYTKTIVGWLTALFKGTAGYPQTWEFFRNTLLSGGLFTGLFVGAMKLSAAESPQEKGEPTEAGEEEAPDEAKA